MPWQERLKPAAVTSPSEERIEFIYEDVSKETDKHTTAFEFPDAVGTFVQVLGRSGRRLPMRHIFSGSDYDVDANRFDNMLDEDGIFILEHPMYGTFNVVPFGKIKRTDELKTRGNQAVFEIIWFETNELLFPLQTGSPSQDLLTAIEDAGEAAAEEFEETINQPSVTEKKSLRDQYKAVIDQVKGGLAKIAAVQAAIEGAFDAIQQAIDDAIQTFIADPLALAFQTVALIQAPARAFAAVTDRIEAYGSLLGNITKDLSGAIKIYIPSNDSSSNNNFRSDDMISTNLLMGSAASVLFNEFETKSDALAAAEAILLQLDDYTAWHDENLVSLGLVDTGTAYQQVLNAMALASGLLVQISFSLKQERSIVLVEATTPIELEARFYGTIDENLDFIISSNNLVGTDILEVPIGREVVYYI